MGWSYISTFPLCQSQAYLGLTFNFTLLTIIVLSLYSSTSTGKSNLPNTRFISLNLKIGSYWTLKHSGYYNYHSNTNKRASCPQYELISFSKQRGDKS